jgi:hypothetical protein
LDNRGKKIEVVLDNNIAGNVEFSDIDHPVREKIDEDIDKGECDHCLKQDAAHANEEVSVNRFQRSAAVRGRF